MAFSQWKSSVTFIGYRSSFLLCSELNIAENEAQWILHLLYDNRVYSANFAMEIACNFHSSYKGSFQIVVDSYCCVMG